MNAGVARADDSPPISQQCAGERVFIDSCLPCHQSGSGSGLDLSAPGTLARRALTAAQVVRDRTMPPWLPSSAGPPLRHSRALNGVDRAALLAWLESGARSANSVVPSETATEIPAVLTVRFGEGWSLSADPGLSVRSFALTPLVAQPLLIGGFELVADAPGVVHGVSLLWDQLGYGVRLDASDITPGYEAVGDIGLHASGSAGAISRLSPRLILPRGYAIEIPRSAALVVEAHAQGRGKVESPAATIRFLAASADARIVHPYSFSRVRPAVLTAAGDAIGVSVRAGSRVKSIEVLAVDMWGATTRLLTIPAWNEQFSEPWFFDQPIALCEGTRLEVRSTANPAAELLPLDTHAAAMSEPTVVVLVADSCASDAQ
ncbi:MAG: hypothetical protein EXS17_04110 [Phycisphaerales bacterium]|nr:hypothetical protein [Phycisphaerales bacterium]